MFHFPLTLRQLLILDVALALYRQAERLDERGNEPNGDSDWYRDVRVVHIIGHELQHEAQQVVVAEVVRDMLPFQGFTSFEAFRRPHCSTWAHRSVL